MGESRKLSYGIVELRDNNILSFTPDHSVFKEYDLHILEELLVVFKEITEGVPRPYLADNRFITGIVTKEEKEFMNKHFEEFATKAALLTDSLILPYIVNSYNSVFKPVVEVKLFNDEEVAVKWLLRE